MKDFVQFVLLFVSLSYAIARNGVPFKPIMSLRLDRSTSYCNRNYCNITTACRPINRTSKFAALDIYFHPGVKLEAPVYAKVVTFKKFATVYRPHMVNFKTELCKELALKSHPLLFRITNDTTISANLFDPCPLTGHRHSKPRITNIYDYVSPLLPIIPAGEWKIEITLSVPRNGSEVKVVSWSDYYEVKSLTAEEF